MSDEKEAKTEAAEAPKKKKIPAIALVAVGAAVGGAGVVFLLPKPSPAPHEVRPPEPKFELRESGDIVRVHFNPLQERGSMVAKIEFHFVYMLDVNHEKDVTELIKKHWNQMYSRVLLRMRRETPQSLRDPDAVAILESDLVAEMSASLFPKAEAVVKQIVWKGFYLQ